MATFRNRITSTPTPWNKWLNAIIFQILGTMFITYMGLASVATTGGALPAHAFAEGSGYFIVILLFYFFTDIHMNWSITLSYILYDLLYKRKFNWIHIIYLPAQYVGGLLAALLTWATTGSRSPVGLGIPVLSAGVSDGRGFVVELILTVFFVVVFIFTKELSESKPKKFPWFIFAFGILFVLIGLIFFGAPITGGSISSVRYLAPLTISTGGVPSNWWVWVIAPLVASIVATLIVIYLAWATGIKGKEQKTQEKKRQKSNKSLL